MCRSRYLHLYLLLRLHPTWRSLFRQPLEWLKLQQLRQRRHPLLWKCQFLTQPPLVCLLVNQPLAWNLCQLLHHQLYVDLPEFDIHPIGSVTSQSSEGGV